MSWHFLFLPLAFFWLFGFRRHFRHDRLSRRDRLELQTRQSDPELLSEMESQRGYIGDLETRVAELENRLDFTERLLATRANADSVR
jgi:hypothetical protein